MPNLTMVMEALRGCSVDTTDEQTMLEKRSGGMAHPVLLVAGDEPGKPLDLMEGLGLAPLSPDGKPLPYPVRCVWGEKYGLTAVDHADEKHHFVDAASLMAHMGDAVRELIVTACAPLLRDAELLFVTVREETIDRLPEMVGGCAGALVVLDRAAGAPEPAVSELCGWLRDSAGLGEKVALILNHAEPGTVNWGLENMLDVEPIETFTSYSQAAPGTDKTPEGALAAAVRAVMGAVASSGEQGLDPLIAQCVASARKKLEAERETVTAQAQERQEAARWFKENGATLRAKLILAGEAMDFQLSPSRKMELSGDIRGLTKKLQEELPKMGLELVEQNGPQAKQDIVNLGGEYEEALLNSYMEFITNHIIDVDVQPKVDATFEAAREEFTKMASRDDLPRLRDAREDEENMELLKAIQVNLGVYHDKLAGGIGSAAGFVIRRILRNRGILAFLLSFVIEELIKQASAFLMPPKQYVNNVINEEMLAHLDEKVDAMFKTLEESVFPQLNEQVKAEYEEKMKEATAQMDEHSAKLQEEAQAYLDTAAALEAQMKALEAACLMTA